MAAKMKPIPLVWVVAWGFIHITYGIVKEVYGMPIQVYTYSSEFFTSALPFLISLFLVCYSFYYSSSHRVAKTILLGLYLIDAVVLAMTFTESIGIKKEDWTYIVQHWPADKYFWRFFMGGLKDLAEAVLIGISFWKSQPYFFEYKKINPLQNILMKLIGVVYTGFMLMTFGLVLLFGKFRDFF